MTAPARNDVLQIGELIRRAARFHGNDVALVHGRRSMSFRELDTATDRVGHGLLRKDVRAKLLAEGER